MDCHSCITALFSLNLASSSERTVYHKCTRDTRSDNRGSDSDPRHASVEFLYVSSHAKWTKQRYGP